MQEIIKNFSSFRYTDMACELFRQRENGHVGNALHETHQAGSVRWEKLTVPDAETSHILGKSPGMYYTVHTGELHLATGTGYRDALSAVSHCLTEAIRAVLPAFRAPEEACVHGISPCDTAPDSPGEEAEAHLATSPEWERGQRLQVVGAKEVGNTALPVGDAHVEASVSEMLDLPPVPLPQSWGEGSVADGTSVAPYTVLCVGLGNPSLTPDALGPQTVSKLVVTRHMTDKDTENALFSGVHRVCAYVPMVRGQTGLETLALVRGALDAAKPDLVILIDALAAAEPSSLLRTVQIATTGIHPGGGVGNKRDALTDETLGVPVITIGVPTVIGAATLVVRVLEQTGILPRDDSTDALSRMLREMEGDCVAPKDIDAGVGDASGLVARALNEVLLGKTLAAEFGMRA